MDLLSVSSFPLLLLFFVCIFPVCVSPSADWDFSDFCPRDDVTVVFRSHCPAGLQHSPPLVVSGEFLDTSLSRGPKNAMYSVLFHAAWCPFSPNARHVFDALSDMYPQITHLVVDESSALPSVLSRYGVRSFPSIILLNQTTRIQYKGLKDLSALMEFYQKVTGLESIVHISTDLYAVSESKRTFSTWHGSPGEFLKREPYLSLAILFVCIRVVFYLFPGIMHKLYFVLVPYSFLLNVGIFEGSRRLLERSLQLIDTKWVWSKLRLSDKKINLQKGANSARVWASSLTSVSLGESSCTRAASSES